MPSAICWLARGQDAKELQRSFGTEILALAISLEEEDIRTYSDLAEAMRENYPGTARMFAAMAEEENGHRHRLLDLYRTKFGDHIPLIRRQDVKGFLERKSFWLLRPLGLEKVRAQVELMEAESISMGFAEALSDDGSLTGRGHPWVRGLICGFMTALGGIGHTLPFLISTFHVALAAAAVVVLIELGVISWIRHRYMETPSLSAALQIGLGGILVFIMGVLIGSL